MLGQTNVQQLLGSSLLSFLLSFMLMKAWLPFAPPRPGNVLMETPLGPLQRILVHRLQAILVLFYVVLGSLPLTGSQWFLPGTQPAALIGLMVVMMLPMRYVFTDRGVALGKGVPHPYKSFRRFDVRQGKRWLASNTTVVLHGRKQQKGTSPSFTLYLPTASTAGVVKVLKRHLR